MDGSCTICKLYRCLSCKAYTSSDYEDGVDLNGNTKKCILERYSDKGSTSRIRSVDQIPMAIDDGLSTISEPVNSSSPYPPALKMPKTKVVNLGSDPVFEQLVSTLKTVAGNCKADQQTVNHPITANKNCCDGLVFKLNMVYDPTKHGVAFSDIWPLRILRLTLTVL